eukprot:TRINITY_DN1233_c0_g1_i1.p1 TRINITY_DN1233_c0_g1~~TRINITY_DN1233_c0_g1_i1.p1  ORF type:complete len:169 (-),score=24.90 TRINITY_DN1233_c0_g1_i1:499-1005(-)
MASPFVIWFFIALVPFCISQEMEDECNFRLTCNDCTRDDLPSKCFYCKSNVLSNPAAICVNESNRYSEICRSGWLEYCNCEEYPDCPSCSRNRGCGWCLGKGCQLGEYVPANASTCGIANYKYGIKNCPGDILYIGLTLSTIIEVAALLCCLIFVVIPVTVMECRRKE